MRFHLYDVRQCTLIFLQECEREGLKKLEQFWKQLKARKKGKSRFDVHKNRVFLQNVAYKFMLEIGNIKVDTQNKN